MPSNLLEMVPSAKCSIPTMRVDRNGELYGEARITMGKAVMVFEIIDEELSAESGPEIEKDPDDIIDEDLSDADWAKIAKALTKKFQREIEQEVKDTMEANKDDDTSSSRYAVRAAMRGQAPRAATASNAGDSVGVKSAQHKQAAGGNNLVRGFQKLAAAVLLGVRGPWKGMEFELLDTFGYGITLNLPAGQHLWASINIHAEGGESKIMIGADLYVNDDMVEEEYKFFDLDTAEGALTSALQKICMNMVALVDKVENE